MRRNSLLVRTKRTASIKAKPLKDIPTQGRHKLFQRYNQIIWLFHNDPALDGGRDYGVDMPTMRALYPELCEELDAIKARFKELNAAENVEMQRVMLTNQDHKYIKIRQRDGSVKEVIVNVDDGTLGTYLQDLSRNYHLDKDDVWTLDR